MTQNNRAVVTRRLLGKPPTRPPLRRSLSSAAVDVPLRLAKNAAGVLLMSLESAFALAAEIDH